MIVNLTPIAGFTTKIPVRAINFDITVRSSVLTWASIQIYYYLADSGWSDWALAVTWDAGTPNVMVYDPVTDSWRLPTAVPPAIGIASRNVTISDLAAGYYTVAVVVSNSAPEDVNFAINDVEVRNLKLDTTSAPGVFALVGDSQTPTQSVTKQIEVRGLPEDSYDFRLWRTTPDQTDITYQDDVYLRGYSEIINRVLAYPNHALMGVRAMATDRLYGGRPTITSVAIGEPLSVPPTTSRIETTVVRDDGYQLTGAIINGVNVTGMRKVLVDALLIVPDSKYYWLVRMDSPGMAQEDRLLTKFFLRVHTWEVAENAQARLYIQSSESFPANAPVMLFHEDVAPTRNVAWAVAKMLIHGSHGRIKESSIHWESFAEWNRWNSELKNGAPRHLYDAAVDFSTDLWDLAHKAAVTARGLLVASGGKYKVIIDRQTTHRQVFGEGNSRDFSLTPIPRADRANILVTSFLDESDNYNQKDISRDDVQGEELPIVHTLSTQVGVVRESQIIDMLDFMLAQNRYIGNNCSLVAGIDSLEIEVGDVFIAASQAKDFAASGRVFSVNSDTCTLDRPFTPEEGITYSFTVWAKDGVSYSWTGTLSGTTVEITTPDGLPMVEEDEYYEYPYVLSVASETRMKFRCLGVKRNGDSLEASITGIEYRDELYLND